MPSSKVNIGAPYHQTWRPSRRNAEQLFPMDPHETGPSAKTLIAFLDKVEDICWVLTERLGDHINIAGELLDDPRSARSE